MYIGFYEKPRLSVGFCLINLIFFRVIVFLSREDLGQFWSQLRITSPWPNTNKLATLVPYLEKMLEGDRPLHMNKYYVHQGVLTPTMKNVVDFCLVLIF